jgi:hypothetical protein
LLPKRCSTSQAQQWGAGLYSGDMAADLRATIKTVLRLPFDEDRIAKRRPGIMFLGCGGRGAAVNDVSICDSMNASSHDWDTWYEPRGLLPEEGPTIMRSLGEILAGALG